jgi:excisionase family DNA binding protein
LFTELDPPVAEAPPAKLLLDAREVAAALRCSRSYVYLLITGGELRAIKLGRLLRVPRAAVDDLIARKLDESELGAR